jgi:hypothetical protein
MKHISKKIAAHVLRVLCLYLKGEKRHRCPINDAFSMPGLHCAAAALLIEQQMGMAVGQYRLLSFAVWTGR